MREELLSTKEASVILGMTQETVSRLIKKGKLEGQKLGGFFVVTRTSVEIYVTTVNGKSKNDPTRKIPPAEKARASQRET
jgi:excisionase family DNA binding protein